MFLACNTDAHAKNYSIMLRGNGASLAPMYDVMCGEVWENVTKNMVQKIGGTTLADQLTGRHWQQLARASIRGKCSTGSPRWQNRSSQKRRWPNPRWPRCQPEGMRFFTKQDRRSNDGL